MSTLGPIEDTYDTVPYASFAFPQTHPDRLATIATLFGMSPAPVERCRVLELGCGCGGNLLPMAALLPESRFVGIDLSGTQIAEGRSTVAALDLKNIDLRRLDLLDLDAACGEFDYILCHGVYSWVPAEVRQKILQICRDCLAPQGVAYVSYNTLPGWNMRGTIRDMMRYHAAKFSAPVERVKQSRALLNFLARSVPAENNAYGMLLKMELETIGRLSDSYLFHDHLAQENNPCYFHEFMEAAQSYELKYLGEADVKAMWSGNLGADIDRTLQGVTGGIIEMEQYMDFLRNRMFRQTLLCHSGVKLKRHLHSPRGLYVAACLKPVSAETDPVGALDIRSRESVTFDAVNGAQIITPEPMMKAALAELHSAWPRSIQFESLLEVCVARLQMDAALDFHRVAQETETLANDLVNCYVAGVIEFCISPSRFTNTVSEYPQVPALARAQAKSGQIVTNLAHAPVRLDDLDLYVARHADGTRDAEALTETLHRLVQSGELIIQVQGERLAPGVESRSVLTQGLTGSLERLAKKCLLLA